MGAWLALIPACLAAWLGLAARAAAGDAWPGASASAFANNVSVPATADAVVSGATLLNSSQALFDGGLSFSKLLTDRSRGVIAAMRDAEKKYGPGSARAALDLNNDRLHRLWFQNVGLWVDRNDKGNLVGYAYGPGGAALGYDRVAGDFFAGAGLSYTEGVLDNRDVEDDNRIDAYRVGLYGGYRHASGFFAKLVGGYAYGDNDMSEYLAEAGGWRNARFRSDSWMIGNICGVEIPAGAFTVTPSVGLLRQGALSHRYTTDGVIRQRFDRARAASLAMPIDLSLSYTAKTGSDSSLSFNLNGGFVHEFQELAPTGTMEVVDGGAPVAIRGMTPDRDALVFGTSLTYRYNRFEFGAAYNYDGKKMNDNHLLNGTFGVSF